MKGEAKSQNNSQEVFLFMERENKINSLVCGHEKGGKRGNCRGRRIRAKQGYADVAFAVMDNYHNKGIGTELFSYLTFLAKKQGLLGFTAEVLMDNRPMLHLCQKMGFDMEKTGDHGVYELKMMFRKK
jgi:GNAT superfamily N-acetyltransferase